MICVLLDENANSATRQSANEKQQNFPENELVFREESIKHFFIYCHGIESGDSVFRMKKAFPI